MPEAQRARARGRPGPGGCPPGARQPQPAERAGCSGPAVLTWRVAATFWWCRGPYPVNGHRSGGNALRSQGTPGGRSKNTRFVETINTPPRSPEPELLPPPDSSSLPGSPCTLNCRVRTVSLTLAKRVPGRAAHCADGCRVCSSSSDTEPERGAVAHSLSQNHRPLERRAPARNAEKEPAISSQ
jgi:hypothetical protein